MYSLLPNEEMSLEHLEVIAQCAMEIGKELPAFDIKRVQNKKKITQEMLRIIHLPASEERTREYRAHAKIYKRDGPGQKPLSLHEIAINEAAAQLCLWAPPLLTRRDQLFPLARQTVKNAGYFYVKAPSSRFLSTPLKFLTSRDRKRKSEQMPSSVEPKRERSGSESRATLSQSPSYLSVGLTLAFLNPRLFL